MKFFESIMAINYKKYLETFAVVQFLFVFLLVPFIALFFSLILLFTPLAWLVVLYALWLYYDCQTPQRGGRRSQWFRGCALWRRFVDYFPVKLCKTTDLAPSQNYLFACHPHGILTLAGIGAFGTEAAGFSELFPGITVYPSTLRMNFWFPIRREYLLALGAVEVSKESLQYVLNPDRCGNAAVVVVGGAAESLDAHPGKYDIYLKNRKGFVKIALQTGAQLVPVIYFGENDLFVQVSNPIGSKLRNLQQTMKSIYHFTLPIFHGQGMFNDVFGFMPFRKPLNAVVGAPLPMKRCDTPTKDQIDELHATYVEALVKLYEENKSRFGVPETTNMNII